MVKVLIGCPTYDGKAYCLDKYLESIKNFKFKDYELVLVDNSKTEDYFNLLKSKGINVIRGKDLGDPVKNVVVNRNLLRDYFLKKDFDYFFSLEQDVIAPNDVIEKLISHKKEVISGVYYTVYRFKGEPGVRPLLWAAVEGKPDAVRFMSTEAKKPGLYKIKWCGLGCLMIARKVIKDIKFRYVENSGVFDDVWFCKDAEKKGYEIWADTSVQCDHELNFLVKPSEKAKYLKF
ncbi:hypothetical protein HY498_03710 [Candidatus Woesearchaeota archaeon]|nr:hypothetical protein [Candidatus Woesearchaeota archaeon]